MHRFDRAGMRRPAVTGVVPAAGAERRHEPAPVVLGTVRARGRARPHPASPRRWRTGAESDGGQRRRPDRGDRGCTFDSRGSGKRPQPSRWNWLKWRAPQRARGGSGLGFEGPVRPGGGAAGGVDRAQGGEREVRRGVPGCLGGARARKWTRRPPGSGNGSSPRVAIRSPWGRRSAFCASSIAAIRRSMPLALMAVTSRLAHGPAPRRQLLHLGSVPMTG
jgi:hypothetical protein